MGRLPTRPGGDVFLLQLKGEELPLLSPYDRNSVMVPDIKQLLKPISFFIC